MKLEFTLAAVSDLQSIRAYTLTRWGEQQEEVYLEAIWSKLEELLSGNTPSRFRHDLFPDCQIASQAKHVILFRVRDDTVQVVRILHGAMDFPRHIPGGVDR